MPQRFFSLRKPILVVLDTGIVETSSLIAHSSIWVSDCQPGGLTKDVPEFIDCDVCIVYDTSGQKRIPKNSFLITLRSSEIIADQVVECNHKTERPTENYTRESAK